MRYSLAHPDLFGAAIVLSPAVYFPEPPDDSSTREFGAFGKDKRLFVEKIYRQLNYPALFESFEATGLPLPMFIAVGDDEFKNTRARGLPARPRLRGPCPLQPGRSRRQPDRGAPRRRRRSRLDVWGPTFVEGAKYRVPLPGQGAGDAAEGLADRHRPGGTRQAASTRARRGCLPGARRRWIVAGEPFVRRQGPRACQGLADGHAALDAELGSSRLERAYGVAIDPAGNVVVTGYTNGDFDGAHAGNTTDDVFVAKFDPSGNPTWLRQFGVAGVADRGYAVATDTTWNSMSPATRAETSERRTSATRMSTSPKSIQRRALCCSSSAAPARTRRGGSPRPPTAPRGRHDLRRAGHSRRRARRLGRPLRRCGQPRRPQSRGLPRTRRCGG